MLPDKPSPMPPMNAWESAEQLEVEPYTGSCKVQLIREWLHVNCGEGNVIDVSLLSGEPAGVALNLNGDDFMKNGDIVLPLRRGRSYVVSVTSLQIGRYSSGLPESSGLLWVSWRPEEDSPTIRLE
jgi:hypothetical protein